MTSSNIEEFSAGLERVKARLPEAVTEMTKEAAREAARFLVQATPVDTGRLRGNWQVSAGRPRYTSSPARADRSAGGEATVQRLTRDIQLLGQLRDRTRNRAPVIYLANGTPYARYVEHGTPRMPGAHMLARTVAHLSGYLARRRWDVFDGGGAGGAGGAGAPVSGGRRPARLGVG